MALAFAQSFDCENAQVGNLSFKITNESVSRTIGLPIDGEKFFKGGQLEVPNCTMFLNAAYRSISWTKGVLQSCIEEHWYPLLTILQCLVTCEGRFANFFLYYIRLMVHFTEGRHLNIPYFLRLSLHKMAKRIQSYSKKPETALYHHSLIKILLVAELKKQKRSWEDFLIEAFPGQETQTKGRQHAIG